MTRQATMSRRVAALRLMSLLRAGLCLALCVCAAASAGADVNHPGPLESYRVKIDQSIDRGLNFLVKVQLDAAQAKGLSLPLAGSISDGILKGNTGITSLAVMAFLAKGHTPGQGPYGEVINHGLDYILDQQAENGMLVEPTLPTELTTAVMYSHCIATLLLAETTGMVDPLRQQRIDQALPKALALILKAQNVAKEPRFVGGWRYQPDSRDSDLSLTGWAIMALRAGRLNGAHVPSENIDKAVGFILRCRNSKSGGFGYMPGEGTNQPLTAAAILCLELCGKHGHESIGPASNYLLKSQSKGFQNDLPFYYSAYYCGQAAFQLGPDYWTKFAPQLYENLLAGQQPDGGWPPSNAWGRSFSTAMAILAMTPSYCQLPIYQRDESFEPDADRVEK